MASKRKYKTLTTKQNTKVRQYTKQGKSQAQIAKLLHVSKQRVATAQKKAGVGKRVASAFWKDVAAIREPMGMTHKEATEAIFHSPKYSKKRAVRAGKKWKSYEEKQARMRELRKEFEGDELTEKMTYEMEETYYGDTPR